MDLEKLYYVECLDSYLSYQKSTKYETPIVGWHPCPHSWLGKQLFLCKKHVFFTLSELEQINHDLGNPFNLEKVIREKHISYIGDVIPEKEV